MHSCARSGVKQAVLLLEMDETENYDSLNDTWHVRGTAGGRVIDGGTFTFELIDEESKININKATHETLLNLFEIKAELDSQTATELADSVLDWRDEDDDARDNGAEDGYYSMRRPGYDCRNSDFEVPEELLVVKGMTKKIFDKIKGIITIYGEGAVNINTAGTEVFNLMGMSEELAEKLASFRRGEIASDTGVENVFDDVGEIVSGLNEYGDLSAKDVTQLNKLYSKGLFTVLSQNFLGKSAGKITGRNEASEIIFVYNRAERKIKYWKET